MYAVFDSAADAYAMPWFLPTEAMALRAFSQCVNNKDHQYGQSPQDYTLMEIGFFDDSTGVVEPNHAIKSHGNGLAYLNQNAPGHQTDLVTQLNGDSD